jgi:L-ascorbate metabolism protein UlaG (beta-lactamase superfamily)
LYHVAPSFWHRWAEQLNRAIEPPPVRPNIKAWSDRGLHAAWLGHSTVLLKIDGFTIVTDPVFSNHAGFHFGPMSLGVKRLVAPAVRPRDLPHVDLVLLSHAHMDHFDIPSVRRLEGRRTSVVTAPYTSDLLRVDRYKEVRELPWGESFHAGPATVRSFRVKHWGARMRSDTYRGYNGYTIEIGRYRVLFAGDTAQTDLFRPLKTSRPFNLAIMPIGAYNPWIRNHCTPEQAWSMGNDAGVEWFIPVHHRTFMLSHEPLGEPLVRLLEAAGREEQRIVVRRIGEEMRVG